MKKRHYYDQPLYAIFKRVNGKLMGYIEHSFSMDWDVENVRLWPKDSIEYLRKEGRMGKDEFVVRAKSKKSPVDIIFDPITKEMRKFAFRNKEFKEKLTTDSK